MEGITLNGWALESNQRGYVYCTGVLHGREWETSYVQQLVLDPDNRRYVAHTQNSTYFLYY